MYFLSPTTEVMQAARCPLEPRSLSTPHSRREIPSFPSFGGYHAQALLTEEEKRLADRAKRFGVTVDTTLEAKRKARAMRFAGSLDDVAKVLKGEKTGAGNKGAKKGEPVVSEEELERMKKRAEKFGKKTSDVLVTEEQRKMKEEMSKAIEERAKRFKST